MGKPFYAVCKFICLLESLNSCSPGQGINFWSSNYEGRMLLGCIMTLLTACLRNSQFFRFSWIISFVEHKICLPQELPPGPTNPACNLTSHFFKIWLNPLNAKLNPICHLVALLGTHHILHISRIRVHITIYLQLHLHCLIQGKKLQGELNICSCLLLACLWILLHVDLFLLSYSFLPLIYLFLWE